MSDPAGFGREALAGTTPRILGRRGLAVGENARVRVVSVVRRNRTRGYPLPPAYHRA
ncbi:hypothetical protein [Nocardia otitidiscaviarum]|uniref:hypothetical protein n=1 Tax=Nocardia otitidiscaviarum TaxID=1823 RepID=UPI002458BBB3|nr:hypothetical protein [Nocardia otitidiscaviarum]